MRLMFTFPHGIKHKIRIIKGLRAAVGPDNMGIKEAKKLCEAAAYNSQSIDIPHEKLFNFMEMINENGGITTSDEQFSKYRDDLKQIAMAATLADDTIIAEEILAFVNDRFRCVKGVYDGE